MNEFHFLRPWWFLALVPALILLLGWWRRRANGSVWQKVIDQPLLEQLWLEMPGAAPRLPLLLLWLGWLIAVVALAGPVWERQPEPVWQARPSRILILDLSASMEAADLAPSRLERARFKITDILKKSREGRTGLVVFAGEPHVVTPLTGDGNTVANLLSALSTDIVPAPGDTVAPALRIAADLLQQAGVSAGDLLLLSDGVADTAAALSLASELRSRGFRLSVLAVGTEKGAPIPRTDGGFAGMARLDKAALQELARTGGGAFSLLAADDRDLNTVLLKPHRSSPLEKMGGSQVQRWVEHGVWLILPLLLLAAAGFRRGWLAGLLAILVLPPPVHAFEWADLWQRPDQQAAGALAQGQAEVAARRFKDPSWRGMAHYQAGDYKGSAEAFAETQGVDAGYNRGNALAKAGQLKAAAESYREVLNQAPGHADAKANLALVEKLLQQQQQQDSQSQQERQDQQSQDDKQDRQKGQADASDSSKKEGREGRQQQASPAGEKEPEAQEPEKNSDEAEPQSKAEESQSREERNAKPQQEDQSQPAGSRDNPAQPDSSEAARRDVADQVNPPSGDDKRESMSIPVDQVPETRRTEADIALDQWLRQIPEDPAGLLRRKFMLEHLKRKMNDE